MVIEDIGIGLSINGVLHITKINGNQNVKLAQLPAFVIVQSLTCFTSRLYRCLFSGAFLMRLWISSEAPELGSSSIC